MKFSQIAAVVVTLIISIVIVMWLASTVPSTVLNDETSQSVNAESKEHSHEDDVELSNPFEISAEGPYPKAVIDSEIFDFGQMVLGETGTHSFVVKNEGDVPLLLAKGRVQCKCTISGLKQKSIEPGAEATIDLEYTPKSTGEFGQGAVIWTNDPEMSEIHIRVEGKMVAPLAIYPSDGWALGAIPTEGPVDLEGSINISTGETFEITKIETSSDAVTMEAFELTETNPADGTTTFGFRLMGSYQPPEEGGPVQEKVTLHTTLEKNPVIEFDITGQRSGPIAVIGPGWSAGLQNLNLGRIDSAKGHNHRLTFMIQPAEEPIEFLKIETDPDFVEAKVEAAKNAPDAARDRFTFIVTIPKGAPKGIWGRTNSGKIRLETNHPKLDDIEISLHMTIQ